MISFILVFSILICLSFVVATDCWNYDSDEVTCDNFADCIYNNDAWGGGWCESLNCWSLWTEDACTSTNIPGKNCTWTSSSNWGWCEQTSCWSYQGNQTGCENSSINGGLNCEWSSTCNGWNANVDCWSLNQTACGNTTGCSWGECYDVGCWNYWNSTACGLATGFSGETCVWDSTNNYCYEPTCWTYSGTNESWCEGNLLNLTCSWIDNTNTQDSCEAPSCYHFNYNQTGVV